MNGKTQTKDLLLGIDIGTTGAKCTFYDFSGHAVSSGYQEYRMIHPKAGWTEQDPHKWWKCVCENIKVCIDGDGIDTSRVAAVAVSSTNAVMLAGKDGSVIYNGVGLHDQRAEPQVAWINEHVGKETVLKYTGNKIAKGSFALPTLRWFLDNRPELIEKTEKFLIPNGWIIYKLTGEFSIDRPRSGLTLLNDLKSGEWAQEIVQKAGIPENILPKIYASSEIVGEVSAQAAKACGLAKGTPVCAGAIDTVAATLGAGAVNSGDCAITIGSSGRIALVSNKPFYDPKVLSTPGIDSSQFLAVQTTDNAGISLKWFRDTFGKMVLQDSINAGISIYEQMNRLCAATTPGSGGLIYLPYLSGEKSPIWNTDARGVFFGIGITTSYSDFIRSVMEGVAYSIRDCLEAVPAVESSDPDAPVPIGGGAARSQVWCQIFSDVLKRPVIQLLDDETETLGDAIIAAQAAGVCSMPPDFGKILARKGKIIEPRRQFANLYDEGFCKYKALYQAVKPLY